MMFAIAVTMISLSLQAEAVPLDSEILSQTSSGLPYICETRKMARRDWYLDDPTAPSPFVMDLADPRPAEGGALLPSSDDYVATVNPDWSGYSTYVSSACMDIAQKVAEGACAIERKLLPPMNLLATAKPRFAQVTARIFMIQGGVYGSLNVYQRNFEQVLPAQPQFFSVLDYQVSCDGNGSVTNITVDKLP